MPKQGAIVYIWSWQAAECPPTFDLLHDHRRLREAQTEAAVLGGDEGCEQAGAGEGVDELLCLAAVESVSPQVLVGELAAQGAGAGAQAVQVGLGQTTRSLRWRRAGRAWAAG